MALRVAIGEYDIGWHDPDASLGAAAALVGRAAASGAELVVLPEMATTGFTMDASQAVPIDAPQVERLGAIAREHRIWLVAGVALREPKGKDSCVVNAAIAFDPGGSIAAVHRKRRLFAYAGEEKVYAAGGDSTIVDVNGVRVALFICYELRFAELFMPAAAECDAMLVIANWPAARRAHWDTLLRARAIENQCVVIGVNRIGEGDGITYDGGSVAYDAWGDPLPHVAEDPPIVEVDPARVAAVRDRYPFLRDRRL